MRPIPLTCVLILTFTLTPLAWISSTPVHPELVERLTAIEDLPYSLRVSQESTGLEELRHVLASAAGLEESWDGLAPEIREELHQLQAPGKWLEETLREEILEKLAGYQGVSPRVADEELFERRPLTQLPLFVYAVKDHPAERELHFHFPVKEPWAFNLLRGQFRIDPSGWSPFPFWLEYYFPAGLAFSEGLDNQFSGTQVPIEADRLPTPFLEDLDAAFQRVVGHQWRQQVLEIMPNGRFFTAEPLLANPETWRLFLRRVRQSSKLQEVIHQQAWGHRAGNWKGYTGHISQRDIVGLPLIVAGQLRRTLDSKTLWQETSQHQLYLETFARGSFDYRSLTLTDAQGKPWAYFDAGFLLVRPGTSFEGKEDLLEEIFLEGAHLSQELDRLLHKDSTWPPRRRESAAGLEEETSFEPLVHQMLENIGAPIGNASEEIDDPADSPVGLEELA